MLRSSLCNYSDAYILVSAITTVYRASDRAYVINLDEYKSIGIHWIALYLKMQYIFKYLDLSIFPEKLKIS